MAHAKVIGVETEYGIVARGIDITPMTASSLLVNAFSDDGLTLRAWDFASEQPAVDARDGWRPEADYPEVEVLMANSVLSNGARYYVDHAHPEMSTPECASPLDVVLYDRAGEEIIRESMRRANQRLGRAGELIAHKNNSDGKGNSYGCHENYLVPRFVPFGQIASAMTAHFVSRQIFCGAGKVGVELAREGEARPSFQLSQRADFFEEVVGLETTVRRPIINTRDEPHADPERWRRLHVIAG
ncbi:MAG: Pup deamidase, partial [Actinomycetota bacterium]